MRLLKCISPLMTLFGSGLQRRCSCFALGVSYFVLLFSSAVQAADYYWFIGSTTGSDPAALCLQYDARYISGKFLDATHYECYVTFTPGGPSYDSGVRVDRAGDSCPSGTTYNSTKGTCDAPDNKCAALKNTLVPSFRFKSTTEEPKGTVPKNGCAISLGSGLCVTRTAPFYDCTFSGVITGDQMSDNPGQTSSDCSGATCTDGQPQKTTKDDPCSAITVPNGFSCTSSKSEDNPGKTNCASSGGAWVCVDNPKPTSSNSTTKTTQTTTANADGSTTTSTTNTTTTTVCKGIGNCATGTTTSVVTGGTNSNGTTKPNSSTCSGPECGGGTVNPGSGSGSGNSGAGEGEGDDEEDKDSVSGDMACTAVVACSGDVIQCAILRQEQQSRCADLDFRDLSDKKVADAKSSLDSEFAGSDYKELKPDADHTFDVSNMIDTTGFLGTSCPALPTIHGSYGQFAVNIDFNLASFCTFLTVLGYINVAFALKRAAVIIGEGAA